MTQAGAPRVSPRVALLPTLAILVLVILRPPEIHPASRIGVAALAPLAFLSCMAAFAEARNRLRDCLPVLCGFAAFITVNTALAFQQDAAVESAERIALAGVVFFVVRESAACRIGLSEAHRSAGRRARSYVLGALAAAGSLSATIAVAQRLFGFAALAGSLRADNLPLRDELLARITSGRVFGTLMLPGSLAGLLSITLPVTLALALGARSKEGVSRFPAAAGVAWLVLSAIQATALFLTGSLAGFIAPGLAASLTVWMAVRSTSIRLALLGTIAACCCLLLVAGIHSRPFDWKRLADPEHPVGLRLGNWIAGARMLAVRPLLGSGGGGYAVLYPTLREEGMNESRHAHNCYLESVVEYGPFIIPLLALFCAAAAARWKRSCRQGPAGAAAAIGLPAFLIHNAVDFTAYQPSVLVPFAALAGALWDTPSSGIGPADGAEPMSCSQPHWRARVALAAVCVAGAALIAHAAGGGMCDLLLEKSELRVERGQSEEALSSMRRAALWAPLDPRPPARESALLLKLGRSDDAIEPARRALSLDPRAASSNFLLGSALLRSGNASNAYVRFAAAEKIYPLRPDYTRARSELEASIVKMRGAVSP